MEKAYIALKQPSGSGGGGTLGQVKFQFNPKEYTVQKTASWKTNPAKGAKTTAMPEFTGAEPSSMTIEIFLDAGESSSGDITKDIETLFKCCTPEPSSREKHPSPPFVVFGWGPRISFDAFVKKVSAKYTLFKPDGTPARAVCSVDLQELPKDPKKQNPTSGGLATLRSHTVVAGDSLPSIAQQEYGEPGLWRAIAVANGIADPLRLATGTTLRIPPAEEAAAYA